MFSLTLALAPAEHGMMFKDVVSVLGPVLALFGVIITLVINGRYQRHGLAETALLQREADQRRFDAELELRNEDRQHEVAVARSVIYAQLARVYRTINGEYGYLAENPIRFVWIPLYTSLLPSPENLKRAEMLSPAEVAYITAFYYSYHEHMGYISAASGGEGKTSIKFDFQLIGVDCADEHRQLRWLVDSMEVLEHKSCAAMACIVLAAYNDYGPQAQMVSRFVEQQAQNISLKMRSEGHLQSLYAKIGRKPNN